MARKSICCTCATSWTLLQFEHYPVPERRADLVSVGQMTRPLASHVLLFFALAACSDKTQPQTGSQTHFLETCNALCPEPYECICGACTLECKSDGPCRDHVDNAHCSVALSTDGLECSTDALVCDVACERNSDCNPLGAGYMCEGGRCRGAVRNSTSSSGATGETPPPPAICDGTTTSGSASGTPSVRSRRQARSSWIRSPAALRSSTAAATSTPAPTRSAASRPARSTTQTPDSSRSRSSGKLPPVPGLQLPELHGRRRLGDQRRSAHVRVHVRRVR